MSARDPDTYRLTSWGRSHGMPFGLPRSLPFRSDGGAWIDAMINEEHLREGWNSVEVYAVRGRGAATNLLLLGGNVSRGLSTEATPGG